MKQIKVLICILIISIGVIFQGEEYEPYLQNFSYEYPSLSIEYDGFQLTEASIIDELLKDAKKYKKISLKEMYEKKLEVIDLSATTLCLEGKLNIRLFPLSEKNSIVKAIKGENIGTLIYN